jgi:hypothetical protein
MSDKTCTKCRASKPLSEFGKHKASPSGFRPVCRACHSAENTARRSAQRAVARVKREAERAALKPQRDEARRKSANERLARWREANRERDRSNSRARWAKDADRLRAYHREYRRKFEERNPGLMRHWVQQYRQLKAQAVPAWVEVEAVREVYELASVWNEIWPEDRVEVDHIVPLRGRNVCGLHSQDNLRIVRWQENRKKGNRYV